MRKSSPLFRYGAAVVAIVLATLLRKLLDPVLDDTAPFTAYFVAIMFTAWYGGLGPSLVALVSGALLACYLFVEPRGSFLIHDLEHQVSVGLYVFVGVVVALLSESLHASRRRTEGARAELADANRGLQSEIAERHRAEQWLLQSEQRFRGYFEQGLIGMAMLSADKDLIEVNHRLCHVLGHSEEELIRKTWTELTDPDDLPGDDAQFQRMLDGVVKGYVTDKRCIRKDGTIVYVSLSAQCMRKGDGTLDCILVLVQDITDRKQLEADLRAAKDSADRAKAVAELANRAKDYFLAVLSHELRTPLAPVVMGVSMLQGRADLDQDMRQTLEMVRRNAEMEARLIDDLLDLTRISRGTVELHKQRVDLGTVIDYAVEVCRPDIEARGIKVSVDMGPDAPYWVEADIARLQQVFWNLLKNAVKFTSQGGCVGIRCRLDGQGYVVADVNDNGIGIDPDAMPRLFNAFEQAERSISRQFGGLGLGLAISKTMVEMHGGSIEAHSEGRGKGATFRVRLPLTVPAGQLEACTPAVPQSRDIGPLRVLLVEDHGATAKIMRMVLMAGGHAVETAGDVATALKLAGQHRFDLLISDLGLPDGSGHDLMRALRSQGHTLPGIALSGYGQEEDIQRSREAGFAVHLTKPVPRERLVEAITSVMAGQPITSATEPASGLTALQVANFMPAQKCG
jgi:two-component system CheB/CheR fusion protein